MAVRILVPIAIAVGLSLLVLVMFFEYDRKLKSQSLAETIIIRLPKVYFWVGAACVVFFALCIGLAAYSGQISSPLVFIPFTVFCALGIFIMATYFAWQIKADKADDYFHIRTMFGRKHKVYYKDCKAYSITDKGLKIQTQSKTFRIDPFVCDIPLINMLNKHNVKRVAVFSK